MSLMDRIAAAIAKHKILTFSELQKLGATGTSLRRMTDEGSLIAVGSGIYASPTLDPFIAAVLATAKYYPQAVISGLTALQLHGFAQEYIEKVDVDIPRETSLRNKMLNTHRVPRSRLVGIKEMKFHGAVIRIYDRERSLCEAYRLDPEGPLFFKALKRYAATGKPNTDLIQKYDQATKTKVLKHLRQELADA